MELLSSVTVEHYGRVAPWITRHLGGVPLITAFYYNGDDPTYAASLHGPPPGHEATVDVQSASGRVQYLALRPTSLLYEAHRGAIEVHSWSPRPDDAARAALARVLVRPDPDRPHGFAATAARALRAQLQTQRLDGIVLRDGPGTIAVWIPLSDGPGYADLRVWLHTLVEGCIATNPSLRAHEFHVTSNAVGHWSLVPYSLIGADADSIATPLRWNELDTVTEPLRRTRRTQARSNGPRRADRRTTRGRRAQRAGGSGGRTEHRRTVRARGRERAGLSRPRGAALGQDDELATHRVGLWTLADLIAVLECQLDHPIMWSHLEPLFAPGRAADNVTAFRAEHLHGAHQRAHVILRYVMEEGLAYQESLADDGSGDALTPEALTVLVNKRLQRENDLARCSSADVRNALAVATSLVFGGATQTTAGGFVIERRIGLDRG